MGMAAPSACWQRTFWDIETLGHRDLVVVGTWPRDYGVRGCCCVGLGMNVRHYLQKAQEADAIADAAEGPDLRRHWEGIAAECRRLAHAIAERQRAHPPSDA